MYRIDQLEDALVGALAAAGQNARPYTREPEPKELARETGERPVVLVSYHRCEAAKSATFQRPNGREFRFHLLVTARNLRSISADAAARGDAAGAGLYATLDSLRALLAGNRLGLAAQPLVFVGEEPLLRTPALAAYRQEWLLTVIE